MLDLTSTGLRIHGSATLENCMTLLNHGRMLWPELQRMNTITVEFNNLENIDSSLLAVLLNWQQQAQQESRTLKLSNVPASLQHLANLYGVSEWIDGLAA